MSNLSQLDAIVRAKIAVTGCIGFSESMPAITREEFVRQSLRNAANVMWPRSFALRYAFERDFESFIVTLVGKRHLWPSAPRGYFMHLVKNMDDAVALLDLFGDFAYRDATKVPGSNEWNNHIKDMWFGIPKEKEATCR